VLACATNLEVAADAAVWPLVLCAWWPAGVRRSRPTSKAMACIVDLSTLIAGAPSRVLFYAIEFIPASTTEAKAD
jgi:hypothetical protein